MAEILGGRGRRALTLMERPEWLSPRDIAEVFGVGTTQSYKVCQALPHIYIGSSIRVNRASILAALRDGGRLPVEDYRPRSRDPEAPDGR
jgi:hypothetical protein